MTVPSVALLPTPPTVKTSVGLRGAGRDESLQTHASVKGNVPVTKVSTLAPSRVSTFERSIEAVDIEQRIEDSRRATKEKYDDLTTGVAREKARELALKGSQIKARPPTEGDALVSAPEKKADVSAKHAIADRPTPESSDPKEIPASEKQKPGVHVSSEIARAQIAEFVRKSGENRASEKIAAKSNEGPSARSEKPRSNTPTDDKPPEASNGKENVLAPEASKIKEQNDQKSEQGAKAVIAESRVASEAENVVKRKAEAEKNQAKEEEVQVRKFERKRSELFLKTGLQKDYREVAAQSKRGEERVKLEATFKKIAAKKEDRLARVAVRGAETDAANQFARARDLNHREIQKNIQNQEIAKKVRS
ncbi:MAG: hypothetical protein COV44_09720 [Deltaproteobacteria bacterium CG11_big_fil_rev_8_21_14_0_20_45_16]|nr:MAG: hypothetical protein COV44_09720 [Deltaproteobacteria bacterium CG11_big_fil_rev_8_21_14_0_20_45_16]